MNINISNIKLDNFILKNHEYLVDKNHYNNKSGQNEYRLYSYLSTFFNDCIILDIGTKHGRSSVALSHNSNNKVITYDIQDRIINKNHNFYKKKNIKVKIGNILDDLNEDLVSKCKIVMIDIDHYEKTEKKIIERLDELKFSGLILLDDINHPYPDMNKAMKSLWNDINEKKYDLTSYGHGSGTGLVLMNTDINIILS